MIKGWNNSNKSYSILQITGTYSFANRVGRIPNFNSLDSDFFGLFRQMVNDLEPGDRLVLETTYEAIVDAGNHNLAIILFIEVS